MNELNDILWELTTRCSDSYELIRQVDTIRKSQDVRDFKNTS